MKKDKHKKTEKKEERKEKKETGMEEEISTMKGRSEERVMKKTGASDGGDAQERSSTSASSPLLRLKKKKKNNTNHMTAIKRKRAASIHVLSGEPQMQKAPQDDQRTRKKKKGHDVRKEFPVSARFRRELGDRFTALKKLGSGTYGQVLRVKRQSDGNIFAMKVQHLRSHEWTCFFRELDLLHRLQGEPKILTVEHFGSGRSSVSTRYLLMPEAHCTLSKWIHDHRSDTLTRYLAFPEMRGQLVSALESLRRHGIVHRDIKPDNVLLYREQNGIIMLKLADFGLGCGQHSNVERPTDMTAGLVTLQYRAPELLFPQLYETVAKYVLLADGTFKSDEFPATPAAEAIRRQHRQLLHRVLHEPGPIETTFWYMLPKHLHKLRKLLPASELDAVHYFTNELREMHVYDAGVDIWATGHVLGDLLMGREYFTASEAGSPWEYMLRLEGIVPTARHALAALSSWWARWLRRLAKDYELGHTGVRTERQRTLLIRAFRLVLKSLTVGLQFVDRHNMPRLDWLGHFRPPSTRRPAQMMQKFLHETVQRSLGPMIAIDRTRRMSSSQFCTLGPAIELVANGDEQSGRYSLRSSDGQETHHTQDTLVPLPDTRAMHELITIELDALTVRHTASRQVPIGDCLLASDPLTGFPETAYLRQRFPVFYRQACKFIDHHRPSIEMCRMTFDLMRRAHEFSSHHEDPRLTSRRFGRSISFYFVAALWIALEYLSYHRVDFSIEDAQTFFGHSVSTSVLRVKADWLLQACHGVLYALQPVTSGLGAGETKSASTRASGGGGPGR